MEFVTLCLEDWQAALNRGLDVLSFSVPPAFLTVCPNIFQPLFAQAVDDLDAVHGHAGYAVNLSHCCGAIRTRRRSIFWPVAMVRGSM
nr:type VI immunity family protein [Burkholderia pseudomallei]